MKICILIIINQKKIDIDNLLEDLTYLRKSSTINKRTSKL